MSFVPYMTSEFVFVFVLRITMKSWVFMYFTSTHCGHCHFDAQIFMSLASGSPFKLAAVSF